MMFSSFHFVYLPNAITDSFSKYIFSSCSFAEKNSEDACAWNMLGILRERMGLKESTLHAFTNAYKRAPEQYRDFARVNYGRSLFKMGKYSEAIDILQEVQEATFSSGSTLALTLFNGEFSIVPVI